MSYDWVAIFWSILMSTQLEHANLCVSNIDGMIKFLQTALPDFIIRHDETDNDGDRWVHIGNDKTYIALNNSTQEDSSDWAPYSGKPGVNHLGYMVDSVEQVRSRLKAAGYIESTVENNHPFGKGFIIMIPKVGIGSLLSITQMT